MKIEIQRQMKDTRIEWIGALPLHWNVLPIGYSTYVKGRVGWHGLSASEFLDEGPHLVTGTDFEGGCVEWRTCYRVSEARYLEDPYIQLRDGDLLITKDGTIGKLALVSDLPNRATLNSGIFLARPLAGKYETSYLYWVLSSDVFLRYIDIMAQGSTINHLYQHVFKRFRFPWPPADEQRRIAEFLKHKTAKADALIAKYERLVELLEEQRVALITQAVIKGLDSNVPMKDSGVEWIGEIPTTWKALPIRRGAASVQTGGTPTETLFSEHGLPWYTPACFGREISISPAEQYVAKERALENGVRVFPACSVLVVGIGATLGKVGLAEAECTTNQQLNAIITNGRMAPRYLAYALYAYSDVLKALSSAATLPILNQSKMKEIVIPHPDAESQQEIIRFLDETASATRGLVSNAMRAIELVKERRSALITAAVTGQIDVHADDAGQVEATA